MCVDVTTPAIASSTKPMGRGFPVTTYISQCVSQMLCQNLKYGCIHRFLLLQEGLNIFIG